MKNVKAGHTRPIVCIDAGHYGKYNRSPAVKSYYESEMTWKLHLMLKSALEAYGIEVRTTRAIQSNDLSVYNRGKASNGSDLFLSLHSNAVGSRVDESVDRVVVIVQLDGRGTELGTEFAKVISGVMQTKQAYRVNTRKGISGEYYGVLRGAAAVGTVGMILEHSFHTQTRATNWLLDEGNLAKLAKAEAKVVASWFGLDASSSVTVPNMPEVSIDPARSYSASKKGTYKVKSSDGTLNLRAGASVQKALVEVLQNGDTVTCYGYYTSKWLYVISENGKRGFCHSGYLTKV